MNCFIDFFMKIISPDLTNYLGIVAYRAFKCSLPWIRREQRVFHGNIRIAPFVTELQLCSDLQHILCLPYSCFFSLWTLSPHPPTSSRLMLVTRSH